MSGGHIVRLSVIAGVALLVASAAHADDRDCTGYGSLADNPKVDAAKVIAGGKTNFIKSAMDDKACPADTAACRRKGFLLTGNAILVAARTDKFVCATYANAKGVETNGWLPASAVAVDATAATPDWAGTWVREEATVTIKPGAKETLTITGDASYGAKDPDRVKRGAVNMGSIAATLAPKDDRLAFAMGDNDKTLPVDKGDDSTCKVWMRRVGAYLLVDDNNACGGFNVSFRGTYVRR